MSRSFRKTPIVSFTGSRTSEKWDKKQWHSSLRAKEKQALKLLTVETLDTYIPLTEADVSDLWSMNKDGKTWFGREFPKAFYLWQLSDEYFLEWQESCKKLMRK